MDTRTALGVAGGLSLTVVGAVSALALTFGVGTANSDSTPVSTPTIEYVDQYGNPVDLQQAPSEVSQVDQPAAVVQPTADETMIAAAAPQPRDTVQYQEHDDDHEGYEVHDDD